VQGFIIEALACEYPAGSKRRPNETKRPECWKDHSINYGPLLEVCRWGVEIDNVGYDDEYEGIGLVLFRQANLVSEGETEEDRKLSNPGAD
jgi:hypothetical protein